MRNKRYFHMINTDKTFGKYLRLIALRKLPYSNTSIVIRIYTKSFFLMHISLRRISIIASTDCLGHNNIIITANTLSVMEKVQG